VWQVETGITGWQWVLLRWRRSTGASAIKFGSAFRTLYLIRILHSPADIFIFWLVSQKKKVRERANALPKIKTGLDMFIFLSGFAFARMT
jgi:hypothetical protein